MLTASVLESSDPVKYVRDSLSKFAEILAVIEEYKKGLNPDQLGYFQMAADKLIGDALERMCNYDENPLSESLDERKDVLSNEELQMQKQAYQMRSIVI